jgi:biotin transport system substrate-specific component
MSHVRHASTHHRLDRATLVGTFADVSVNPGLVRAFAVVFITALTAAAAQISLPLPFTPVPFTLQPMIVLIGGAALGARAGAASQLVYLALGLLGLPVFAHSPLLPQGLGRLLGPTGGYLMAYPAAAFVVGLLAERHLDRRYHTAFLAMLAGLAIIFAGGVLWLGIFQPGALGLDRALQAGVYPFVVPDLFKAAVAAGATPALWRLLGPPRA